MNSTMNIHLEEGDTANLYTLSSGEKYIVLTTPGRYADVTLFLPNDGGAFAERLRDVCQAHIDALRSGTDRSKLDRSLSLSEPADSLDAEAGEPVQEDSIHA